MIPLPYNSYLLMFPSAEDLDASLIPDELLKTLRALKLFTSFSHGLNYQTIDNQSLDDYHQFVSGYVDYAVSLLTIYMDLPTLSHTHTQTASAGGGECE